MGRLQVRSIFAFIFLSVGLSAASAQTYPTKPSASSSASPGRRRRHHLARDERSLTRVLGQGIIVDNKPGAGSSLAAEYVAKVAPDGYTIMIASQSGMIINPIVNKNISYDTERDFVAITQVTSSPSWSRCIPRCR